MEAELVIQLEEVLRSLTPWLSLTNCHMVNFITKKLWQNFVPEGIKSEFVSLGLDAMEEIFWCHIKGSKHVASSAPNFTKFLDNAWNVSLRGGKGSKLVMSQDQLWSQLASWDKGSSHQEGFMSRKKLHEVGVMSRAVASLSHASCSTHVVDIGGGKGYMSSLLALSHELPTLSIDSSDINTHGAAKRTRKLAKVWNGITRRAEEMNKGESPSRRGKHWKSHQQEDNAQSNRKECTAATLYKQLTAYVKEDTDIGRMVEEQFGYDRNSLRLTVAGLHTCGNLASTCLRMFVRNEQVRALCCVGCCYHLLEEEFCQNPFWNVVDPPPETFGFPMSRFLRSCRFSLGRNTRMLAAQSLDRIATCGKLESQPLFYRALLQVMLEEHYGNDIPWGQVGHLSAKYPNFQEYVPKALEKLQVNVQVTRDEIESLYQKHKTDEQQLHLFFLLRVSLAPVVETVVLLDRVLYLHEQGFHGSFLVQLFDPVISPRCYSIIALKDEKKNILL